VKVFLNSARVCALCDGLFPRLRSRIGAILEAVKPAAVPLGAIVVVARSCACGAKARRHESPTCPALKRTVISDDVSERSSAPPRINSGAPSVFLQIRRNYCWAASGAGSATALGRVTGFARLQIIGC